MTTKGGGENEAIVDVVEQSHDDDRSLRRRQSAESHLPEKSASSEEPSVCTIFSDSAVAAATVDAEGARSGGDPFENISIQQRPPPQPPTEIKVAIQLTISVPQHMPEFMPKLIQLKWSVCLRLCPSSCPRCPFH